MLFLYRQAVETAIKAVLLAGGYSESVVICERGHSLSKQIPDLKEVAARHDLPISQSLEDLIERWHEDDPDGMRSRYPTDKSGKATDKDGKRFLIANETRFHLQSFVNAAEEALDELNELLQALGFEEYCKIVADEEL